MGYRKKYARKKHYYRHPTKDLENKFLIRILLLIALLLFSFILYISGGIKGFIQLL